MSLPKLKSTQTLPEIIAIIGYRDYGPSDGEGSTICPHCGARGRYVWTFICADGTRRGAMSGCIQLFPRAASSSRYARLIQQAFEREKKAQEEGRKLASWWQEMIDAAKEFSSQALEDHDQITVATQVMYQRVGEAEGRRQEWLSRNGYNYPQRRRR